MKRKELLQMIAEGESLRCEFKLKFSSPEKIAKEMIAFANTKGGYMIFGVDDNRNIVGVESEKEQAELINDAVKTFCEPPVMYKLYYIEVLGKELVVAEVFESDDKPHRLQDYTHSLEVSSAAVYVRVNDKSVLASKEMIRLLRAAGEKKSLTKYFIGDNEKIVFDYLTKNEIITVKRLSEIANLSERRASRTLVKMVRANLILIHTKDNGEEFFTYAG